VTTFQPSPVEDADRVNDVSILNREDELAGYLRIVDPQICKLRYLKQSGHKYPYVYVDIFGKGKELIPATQLGQGIARMLELFSSLMIRGTQILLIDEFENGLQHDALVPIWSALGKFAREHDIQIFVTTHSYECIAAAHKAFSENKEDFAVIKLCPDMDKCIAAVVLDSEAVGAALKTELEIR
jgi:predicted ATPase